MQCQPGKVLRRSQRLLNADSRLNSPLRGLRQGIMERWSGKQLKNSAIYGVRVYRRGSMLHNHVDRSDTHIISAIVNVAQQVRCLLPWRQLHAGAGVKMSCIWYAGLGETLGCLLAVSAESSQNPYCRRCIPSAASRHAQSDV